MRRCSISLSCVLLASGFACGFEPYERCTEASPGALLQCKTPGELDRAFDLEVPESWDGSSALPLIYAFHGGGGHRQSAESLTCPDGESGHEDCLSAKARARGYVVVRPDGSGSRPLRNIRTWNAGGGTGGWTCVSGASCSAGVDDMAYLDTVHAEVTAAVPIDPDRIYATGISNGGAISHRLACERPLRIAAAAPVAGTNQFAAAGGSCQPGAAILQIHGTEDPIWRYETSALGGVVGDGKLMLGAEESTQAWAQRNGCSDAILSEDLPDTSADGTRSTHLRYQECASAVELIRIEGGGHTWPQGDPYFSEERIGIVARDFDADDLILDFFDAHTR